MHAELSFEQAPPISVPYRFFLSAPWFGVAAGILVLVRGEAALTSRWMPETLALTHLIVAGYMLQAMCGALLQFVPIATGGNVWRPKLATGFVHPILLLGAILLSGGLLLNDNSLLLFAAPLLLLGVGAYVAVLANALWKTTIAGGTVACLKLAIISLGVTVSIGALMAEIAAGGQSIAQEMTAVHVGWGLGGWSLALLAGVSQHVVPMFQMTKPYPRHFARWVVPTLAAMLVIWSGQWLIPENRCSAAAGWGLLLVAATYGALTIRLQMGRKRKATDNTFWLFRAAMISLIATVVVWAVFSLMNFVGDPRVSLMMGLLICAGGIVSAINGMLYKIVPFMTWLHLQELGAPLHLLPNMKQIIPERSMRGQTMLHFLAVILILLSVWLPMLCRPAGAVWAASSAWLGFNLLGSVRRYVLFKDRIRASASCPVS